MQYIAFDSHKRYTQASVISMAGTDHREARVAHEPGAVAGFLRQFDPGSPVAVESIGNWYWIVDEIEKAGMVPRLVHPRKAKLMMGMINKTDKLDARGMNRLQQSGTLPVVWIPPGDLRDKRDLPRTRMVLVQQRTRLKNRIHATMAKYALSPTGVSDTFGKRGRAILMEQIGKLPPETKFVAERLMEGVTSLDGQIEAIEGRMREVLGELPEVELRRFYPCHSYRPGSRGCGPFPGSGLPGILRRDDSARSFQRRKDPLRDIAHRRKPVSEVGVCRGGQQHQHQLPALALPTCLLLVPEDPRPERTPESRRSGGAASGGGNVLDIEEGHAVFGTGVPVGFVHEGVSAGLVMNPLWFGD